jgi:hypothetical protein
VQISGGPTILLREQNELPSSQNKEGLAADLMELGS